MNVFASTIVIAISELTIPNSTTKTGQVRANPFIAQSGLIVDQSNPSQTAPWSGTTYHRAYNATNVKPTNASTIGYSGEIGTLQNRHLPRRKTHPKTGMFSRQVSRWSHFGHREGGVTTLRPSGIR